MQAEPTCNKVEFGPDLFKKKERSVKQFMRICMEDPHTKKQRLWKESNDQKPIEPPFEWNEVLDVRKIGENDAGTRVKWQKTLNRCCSPHEHECCGTLPQLYELEGDPPGLFIISNALCALAQLYWAKKGLVEYSKVEHTNLSNLAKLYADDNDEKQTTSSASPEVKLDEEGTNDLWQQAIAENKEFSCFKRLRWSCLGYHYDWTKRSYQKNTKSCFPADLAQLCRTLATFGNSDLIPEAAIVNFYPMNTNMGGHLDDAEHDLGKPIISISIGCSALYLLGGKKKDVSPIPILLRSGDAIIMTGESRLCYHGIPAIIPKDIEAEVRQTPSDSLVDTLAEYLREDSDREMSEHVLSFLNTNRINVNARQVRYEGEEWQEKAGTGHVKYVV